MTESLKEQVEVIVKDINECDNNFHKLNQQELLSKLLNNLASWKKIKRSAIQWAFYQLRPDLEPNGKEDKLYCIVCYGDPFILPRNPNRSTYVAKGLISYSSHSGALPMRRHLLNAHAELHEMVQKELKKDNLIEEDGNIKLNSTPLIRSRPSKRAKISSKSGFTQTNSTNIKNELNIINNCIHDSLEELSHNMRILSSHLKALSDQISCLDEHYKKRSQQQVFQLVEDIRVNDL